MANKPVAIARTKTKRVQADVQAAETKLHASNAVLRSSKVPSTESARAVAAENVAIEEKLHDAVQELDAVGELLKVAEAANAAHGEHPQAGSRSGSGLESIMAHMSAPASKEAPPQSKARAPAAPAASASAAPASAPGAPAAAA